VGGNTEEIRGWGDADRRAVGRVGGQRTDWELHPSYDVPTIPREALEEYLAAHGPAKVESGRLTLMFEPA